jgi:hypothetical protein
MRVHKQPGRGWTAVGQVRPVLAVAVQGVTTMLRRTSVIFAIIAFAAAAAPGLAGAGKTKDPSIILNTAAPHLGGSSSTSRGTPGSRRPSSSRPRASPQPAERPPSRRCHRRAPEEVLRIRTRAALTPRIVCDHERACDLIELVRLLGRDEDDRKHLAEFVPELPASRSRRNSSTAVRRTRTR